MTAAVPETPAAPGQAHPLDLPARAAYAAHYGLSGAQATAELTTCPEGEREHWRMVADAAITAGSFAARQPQAAPELVDVLIADGDVVTVPESTAGSEATEMRAVIDMIWRMCQNPKQAAGTSRGLVVNGEHLAARITGLIKNSGLEPF